MTYIKVEVPPPIAEKRLSYLQRAASAHLLYLATIARDRALQRGAPAVAGALDALLRRVVETTALIAGNASQAAADVALANIFVAIGEARRAADRSDRVLAAELEELPLASAARGWVAIVHIAREHSAGWWKATDAISAAQHELAELLDDAGTLDVTEGATARRVARAAAAASMRRAGRPAGTAA